MKIYTIVVVARQINGEYIAVQAQKSFKTKEKAEKFHQEISKKYKEKFVIKIDNVSLDCFAEVGIFETELEE